MHRRVATSGAARPRFRARRGHHTSLASSLPSSSSASIPPIPPISPKPATKNATASSSKPDPFAPVASHLASLRTSLLDLLGAGHPALPELTQYYFRHPSKQVRPLIVLLMARATNGLGSGWGTKAAEAERGRALDMRALDCPLGRSDVLNDWNPLLPAHTARFAPEWNVRIPPPRLTPSPASQSTASSSSPALADTLLPTQARLAQIVEMMHTASLLHDDVIDGSPLRRGSPSAPAAFTPKLAVLGGNFVLGRASVALARLGESEATELIAGVLANLVEGEILQLREVKVGMESTGGEGDAVGMRIDAEVERRREAWNVYLQKTYLKTASLMAKGARASVVLGGCQDGDGTMTSDGHVKGQEGERRVAWKDVAYAYGRNLGIAFQLVDDVLDYEADCPPPSNTPTTSPLTAAPNVLGKPGGADLGLGLATGPALYAWEEHPGMGVLIGRGFKGEGDVDAARAMVYASSGVQRTRELAQAYADAAVDVLQVLPPSAARDALEGLARLVMSRKS
ncbi:terpenoid synthase [Pholiota conissans]|uniref:(2E,6E)-farnesyl diphosphate synthase n=1 Tax=Pholiota conissans TaxID=109636 RepID=A0A9P6CUB1_9AGAR|nr:terpenoid synthase [Pholiota conissans]